MSAALQPRQMTVPEFLAWEERQPIRYEFDGTQPLAMAGGSLPHAAIAVNLAIIVGGALRGQRCRFYNSDAKVLVAGKIRYPDGSITCTHQDSADLIRQGVVPNPVVIFEVLSGSTEAADRTEKNRDYAATPSIMRYVMLEQDRIACTVFARQGDEWVERELQGAEATLDLPEVGIEAIRLGDLFAGIALPTSGGAG